MKTEKKNILLRLALIDGSLALIAVLFLIYDRVIGSRLPFPCPFKALTRLYCPGCGGTRALHSLLHLDLLSSLIYNPVVVLLFLMLASYNVCMAVSLFQKRRVLLCDTAGFHMFFDRAGLALAILILSFFVLRNVLLVVWHVDPLGDLYRYYV